jgi:hypothetical protein
MKINTSTGAGGSVTVARVKFDRHIDGCTYCTHAVLTGTQCATARSLWRAVCLAAGTLAYAQSRGA